VKILTRAVLIASFSCLTAKADLGGAGDAATLATPSASARTIAPGAGTGDLTASSDQHDMYKVAVLTGETIRATLVNIGNSSDHGRLSLSIYSDDGTLVDSIEATVSSTVSTIEFAEDYSGYVYVRVSYEDLPLSVHGYILQVERAHVFTLNPYSDWADDVRSIMILYPSGQGPGNPSADPDLADFLWPASSAQSESSSFSNNTGTVQFLYADPDDYQDPPGADDDPVISGMPMSALEQHHVYAYGHDTQALAQQDIYLNDNATHCNLEVVTTVTVERPSSNGINGDFTLTFDVNGGSASFNIDSIPNHFTGYSAVYDLFDGYVTLVSKGATFNCPLASFKMGAIPINIGLRETYSIDVEAGFLGINTYLTHQEPYVDIVMDVAYSAGLNLSAGPKIIATAGVYGTFDLINVTLNHYTQAQGFGVHSGTYVERGAFWRGGVYGTVGPGQNEVFNIEIGSLEARTGQTHSLFKTPVP